jgi:hypothetical protein
MCPSIVSIFQYISNKMQRYTFYLYLKTLLHDDGWYFHPSSGANTRVSTVSGICHTVTAICRYRGGVGTGLSVLRVAYAYVNNLCNVASWYIYIGILLGAHYILHFSRIRVKAIILIDHFCCDI